MSSRLSIDGFEISGTSNSMAILYLVLHEIIKSGDTRTISQRGDAADGRPVQTLITVGPHSSLSATIELSGDSPIKRLSTNLKALALEYLGNDNELANSLTDDETLPVDDPEDR